MKERLNYLLSLDREAITKLTFKKVECNFILGSEMESKETEARRNISVLSLLNALKSDGFILVPVVGKDKLIKRFEEEKKV